jgi:hypothetical protein
MTLPQELLVGLQLIELLGGFGIVHQARPAGQLLELGLHLIQLAHLSLGLDLVVPEARLARQLFQILLPCFQGRDVKDSPGLGPGGR